MIVPNSTARTAVAQAIAPHLPERWQLVEHEGAVDDGNRVRVRVTVRSIAHSDTGYAPEHLVTTQVTVTIPTETLEAAEGDLDDAMDLFLFALDTADIPWTTATKGRYADEGNRLGYQLDIETRTKTNGDG